RAGGDGRVFFFFPPPPPPPRGLVVGVDASPGMLVEARRARPDLPLAAARAIDLPFRDGSFDLVVAACVIAHFTKVDTALFDLRRVLRPGGRIAVSAWAGSLDELQTTWRGLVAEVVPMDLLDGAIATALPWHDRFRRRGALEEALIDEGFRHVRVEEREYRFRYGIDEYVDGLAALATGRFVRSMLGEERWGAFLERVRATFRERFADPLNDFRKVLLGVGTKT
ncbi:MAG: class I SAM-dependent methyltransferase, partial [Actinomycetota bacterium]